MRTPCVCARQLDGARACSSVRWAVGLPPLPTCKFRGCRVKHVHGDAGLCLVGAEPSPSPLGMRAHSSVLRWLTHSGSRKAARVSPHGHSRQGTLRCPFS